MKALGVIDPGVEDPLSANHPQDRSLRCLDSPIVFGLFLGLNARVRQFEPPDRPSLIISERNDAVKVREDAN